MTAPLSIALLLAAGSFLPGCGGDDQSEQTGMADGGAQTQQTPEPEQMIPSPPPGTGEGETGLTWEVPASWKEETPASSMRKAQYAVPGPGGDAEMVVFYFGPGQGGGAQANIDRWISQFAQPDGSSSQEAATTEQEEFAGMTTSIVELKGTYTNRMVSPEAFPDHMLLGAVVEGPDAPWFFKMTGPEVTVRYQREAFESLLGSLKAGE